MRKFLIYNNETVFYFFCESLDEAKQKAIMICDHSEEIIVREIKEIRDFTN